MPVVSNVALDLHIQVGADAEGDWPLAIGDYGGAVGYLQCPASFATNLTRVLGKMLTVAPEAIKAHLCGRHAVSII